MRVRRRPTRPTPARPTGAQRQCFGSARRTRIAVSRRRARATACVVCSVVATLMPCTVAVVTGFLPSGTYGPKRRIDGTPVSTRRAPNTCFLPQRQVLSAVGMHTDCNSGQRRRAARSFARRHRLWFVILAARLFVRSPVVLFRVHLPALCCRRDQRRDDRVADRIDRHRRQDHVLVSQSSGACTTTVLCLLCARETT